MTDERYKKIMADLGMPNSRSLLSALQQVANEASQAAHAAERKDAERYRWLRSNPQWLGWEHDFRPDEVEREIDAAMRSNAGDKPPQVGLD